MSDLKHKTVGVSFHPQLRESAASRARQLGLSFSRYVTHCIEQEMGRPTPLGTLASSPAGAEVNGLSLDSAIDAGADYGAAKAQAIGFEEDIQEILEEEDLCVSRMAQIAHLRTDFLVQHTAQDGHRTWKVAIECKHSVRGRTTVTLGQAIILRSLPSVDAVLLCVPYTRNFDAHAKETFSQQGIPITTPDTLIATLEATLKQLENAASASSQKLH
jgi:hypothetical protein